MNGVEFVLGDENICEKPLIPFHPEICGLLSDFSASLRKDPQAKRYPDLMTLAFWARKANIERLKEQFGTSYNRIGRGVCFHITPSNVPVNFAFSLFFGSLAGNVNIVRLPSKSFVQTELICRHLAKALQSWPEAARRITFVRYPSSNCEATKAFCEIADARIIWGGDKTIETFRSFRTNPRCIDINFSDRYSIAIIDARKVLQADEAEMEKLARDFFNDTYLMDQNACSSPQFILWSHDNATARHRFWNAVDCEAQKRYPLQAAVSVDKYVQLCEDAILREDAQKLIWQSGFVCRVDFRSLPQEITELRGKGGYFYECALQELSELAKVLTKKVQTIGVYGVEPQQILQVIIENGCKGVDRIVPIGKALDIDVIWDGYDLIGSLSRIIT